MFNLERKNFNISLARRFDLGCILQSRRTILPNIVCQKSTHIVSYCRTVLDRDDSSDPVVTCHFHRSRVCHTSKIQILIFSPEKQSAQVTVVIETTVQVETLPVVVSCLSTTASISLRPPRAERTR